MLLRRYWLGVFLTAFLTAAPLAYAESSAERKGRELHEQILEELPIYTDPKVVNYVKGVGQRIAEISNQGRSEKKRRNFTFTVVDDQTINAFALPGGYIYIHRGLLTYLNSEAQLAAVLAHEVAHVTKNHHGRQRRAAAGNAVVAGVLGVLTRSAEVAEASALWGQSVVSGFGREMELEADGVGADYMTAAGYGSQAMLDVIALLKDHQRLEKIKARESGKKVQTYHGIFASHPRHDTRLQKAVGVVDNQQSNSGKDNAGAYRLATEGLVWGENFGEVTLPDNVYQNDRFSYRLSVPPGWQFAGEGQLVTGKPHAELWETQQQEKEQQAPYPEHYNDANLTLEVMRRTTETPDVYIKKRLNIPMLKKSEAIRPNRVAGHTGLISASGNQPEQRLAVLYYSRYAYVFKGDLAVGKSAREQDKLYQQIIHSFRPIARRAGQSRDSKQLHYVKATANTNFAALARYLKLDKYGEQDLRIINGYYPVGEPKPGEWIKIIR